MKALTIILGNQLFPLTYYTKLGEHFFMCEDKGLCTHFKYHKFKILHFLSSMRHFRDELKKNKKKVHYIELKEKAHYEKELTSCIRKNKFTKIFIYEIEDKFFEKKIFSLIKKLKVELEVLPSPMFLCSRQQFKNFVDDYKKPLMHNFYKGERKRLNILLNNDKSPMGGSWSKDSENRKKIPLNFAVTTFKPETIKDAHTQDVAKLIDRFFPNHPGDSSLYWIPNTRKSALKWMKEYFQNRFHSFGDFQDALDERSPFLYHSLLSPLINIGLLLPSEVVHMALKTYKEQKIPLNTAEGFIRQIIGWREFVRGIYQNFDHIQCKSNFWGHKRKFHKKLWSKAQTDILPVDLCLKKLERYGMNHHIERLMVLSNVMLLLEIDPREVHGFFMAMYVDSSDWVMGPNVYGMGQFSDGGIFATKPYFCASNYIRKMGHFPKGPWCEELDGLYWHFISKNIKFFESNHRLSMMARTWKKLSKEKQRNHIKNAKKAISRLTIS